MNPNAFSPSMLKEVRNALFPTPKVEDSRLNVLRLASTQDVLNCLAIIRGFGANQCRYDMKVQAIKALRTLSGDKLTLVRMSLKDAKDMVEVLSEACMEDSNAADVLIDELKATL